MTICFCFFLLRDGNLGVEKVSGVGMAVPGRPPLLVRSNSSSISDPRSAQSQVAESEPELRAEAEV